MVVKTDLCAFSERRVYPGHGIKFIRRDGQPIILGSSKSRQMFNQKKKPSKLVWTLAWRRVNNKMKDNSQQKKKSRKAVRVMRAIVGASLDDLRSKRQVTKKTSAATDAALKEVKDRAKSSSKKQTNAPRATGAAVPKNQKSFK